MQGMNKPFVEVCVDSVESAIAAEAGGANRLELCSALVLGGITPSLALYRRIRREVTIPVHVLIRCRHGDFIYNEYEKDIMADSISLFVQEGANGVVFGGLTVEGDLHIEQMKTWIKASKNAHKVLHRCFDCVRDPYHTLSQAKELGMDTILTSGLKPTALEGMDTLSKLIKLKDNMEILVGSGVKESNITELYQHTKATQYHFSGKVIQERAVSNGVAMGLMDNSPLYVTSEKRVNTTIKALYRAMEVK